MSMMPASSAHPVAFVFGSFTQPQTLIPVGGNPVLPVQFPPNIVQVKKVCHTSSVKRSKASQRALKSAKALENGGLRLLGHQFCPSHFRWIRSINTKHKYLVYIYKWISLPAGGQAWCLLFVDASETIARFVGSLTVDDGQHGRRVFDFVDTLHDKQLDCKAWWVLKRKQFPAFGVEPSEVESVYFPRPLPEGACKNVFIPFEQGQWVSVLSLSGQKADELGYVYRVLGVGTHRKYVVLLGVELDTQPRVITVYHEFLREPRIDCLRVPEEQDCWWNRQAVLHDDLLYFPTPFGGFARHDVVSVFDDKEETGVCARVVNTWVIKKERYYKVEYPVTEDVLVRPTIFPGRLVRGQHTDWMPDDYSWPSKDAVLSPTLERSKKRARAETPASPPALDLGPPASMPSPDSLNDEDLHNAVAALLAVSEDQEEEGGSLQQEEEDGVQQEEEPILFDEPPPVEEDFDHFLWADPV